MTPEARTQFYRDNASTRGDALMTHMQEVITQITRNTSTVATAGAGDWVDEHDLKARYKDKPDQLKSVMQNAKTMWDEARSVTLYEDMQYVTRTNDEEVKESESKRQIQWGFGLESNKRSKKGKGKGHQAALTNGDAGGETVKKLSKANLKKLKNAHEAAAPMLDKLTELIAKCNGEQLKPHLPQFILSSVFKSHETIADLLPQIDTVINENKHADPDAFVQHVQASSVHLVEVHDKLAMIVTEAEKFIKSSHEQ